MQIEIIHAGKDELEFTIDNQTLAELLRNYLYEHGASFAAWRREHPSKPIIMKVQASNGTAKKAIKDAIAAVMKDIAALGSDIKKAK